MSPMSASHPFLLEKKELHLDTQYSRQSLYVILDDENMADVLRRYNPSTVESLNLSRHSITFMPQAVLSMSHLKVLDMSDSHINDEGIMAIGTVIHTIERLILSDMLLSPVGMSFLGKQLPFATSLHTLDLRGNMGMRIYETEPADRTETAKIFAEALETNSTLQSLDLSNNSIGAEGINALAKALFLNTTLTGLYLCRNPIDYTNVRMFAEALTINSSLKSLNINPQNQGRISANELDDITSFQELGVALTLNSTLSNLSIGTARNKETEQFFLHEMLPLNSSLGDLGYSLLERNPIFYRMRDHFFVGPILKRNRQNAKKKMISLLEILLRHTNLLNNRKLSKSELRNRQ